jgi:hypothetical protein
LRQCMESIFYLHGIASISIIATLREKLKNAAKEWASPVLLSRHLPNSWRLNYERKYYFKGNPQNPELKSEGWQVINMQKLALNHK